MLLQQLKSKYLNEILMMLLTEELEVLHPLLREHKLARITRMQVSKFFIATTR